jgi:hypothetical protein
VTQLNAVSSVAASPGAGLPQLQGITFGDVLLGYGDVFVAAVLGGVLARQGRSQWPMALLTLVVAGLFDLLFFVLDELPATVPVALAMIVGEGWLWARRRRRRGSDVGDGAGADARPDARPEARAQWGPSPPVAAGGRDSSASDVIARTPRAASSSTSVASSAERE